MKDLSIFKATIALLALSAAGCAGQAGTPSVGPPSIGPLSSVTRHEAAPLVTPDGHNKKLAGAYSGSIEWSDGSQKYSGTLATILRFHTKNILGPFKITANGQTHHYRIYGKLKSKTKEEAVIVFLIYNTKGGYATGTGTIANGTFAAKATSAVTGNDPPISMKFTATKNQGS
jgi:hypothetical protein